MHGCPDLTRIGELELCSILDPEDGNKRVCTPSL